MAEQETQTNEVEINLAGVFAGMIVLVGLVWSLINSQMLFAYLNTVLIVFLAVSTHVTNKMYA